MGASISTTANEPNAKRGIFFKELGKVDALVNSIITKNNTFRDNDYNFMNKSVCDKYTMVLGSKLSKHLKLHLQDLASDIYFVPKHTDNIPLKNGEKVTKSELCAIITNHYAKTLRIISMVRNMYDFENGGDYSVAGIIYRNLKQTDGGMFEVSYCGVKQEPLSDNPKVDFSKVKGLDMFINEFLTETEAVVFVKHLRELFGTYRKSNISKLVCQDTLVSLEMYKTIYDEITFPSSCINKIQKGGDQKRKRSNLFITVEKNNPIISYELCFDKKKITTSFSKRIRDLFKKFKDDYAVNLEHVHGAIHKLVKHDNGEYTLRDISHDELNAIETEVKRCIIIMYIQCMVNYFKILTYVKTKE